MIHKFILTLLSAGLFISVHAQLQQVIIQGQIKDTKGNPLENVELTGSFNEQVIMQTKSLDDGTYRLYFENYGDIDNITLHVTASKKYVKIEPIIVPAYGNTPTEQDFIYTEINPKSFTHVIRCGGYRSLNKSVIDDNIIYNINHVTWHFNEDMYTSTNEYAPVICYRKITSNFSVIDEHCNPIKDALVEIYFPRRKKHWGYTNNNGFLNMHMEFWNGESGGKIFISANGYKTRKLRFQTFYATNSHKIVLHKY